MNAIEIVAIVEKIANDLQIVNPKLPRCEAMKIAWNDPYVIKALADLYKN
jgi:hypothetical protein